jgi:pilus assembly protein CpaD
MKMTAIKFLTMALLAALAAGCAGAWNGQKQAMTVAEEHPISVDSQVVTMTIDQGRSASDISSLDKSRLRAFADAYMTSGHGPLSVTAPSGAGDGQGGQESASAIGEYLNELGVDWSQISASTYGAANGSGDQIILSYTHYVATPSACGNWKGLGARDRANMRSPNFGCATQNNIAAMIADPRDLVEPAGDAPPDAAARIRGIRAYREGEVTASETDAEIKTEVAE